VGGNALKGNKEQKVLVIFMLLLVLNPPLLAQSENSFQYGFGIRRPDAPVRTKLYAGVIAGAALYGLLAPKADDFRFDPTDYGASVIPGTSSYRYFVRQSEVTPEEFFRIMDNEKAHDRQAAVERRRARARKKSLRGIVFGTYLIMLADMLWLAPNEIENRSVILRFEGLSYAGSPYGNSGITMQVCLNLR
jgi:hypothetical protein